LSRLIDRSEPPGAYASACAFGRSSVEMGCLLVLARRAAPGHLGSLFPRFAESDRNGLLATGDSAATATTAQGSALLAAHGALHGLLRAASVTWHRSSSCACAGGRIARRYTSKAFIAPNPYLHAYQ